MRFHILTIFPKIFDSYLGESLFKRAIKNKIIEVKVHNIRDFSTDKHQKVDARPFGGGPGMVLKVDTIHRAINSIKPRKGKKRRTILFSTRGRSFDAKTAKRLSKYDELIFICGRYEGVDERVALHIADEEISIGNYILSGGELPAMIVTEAVSRFIPGFLGKNESLEENKGSYPVFTRPAEFNPKKGKAWKVPKVLLEGNHSEINKWRGAN